MTSAPAWPEWLPPAVAEYAEHLLAGRTAQMDFALPLSAMTGPVVSVTAGSEEHGRLHRLTHDSRMAGVWRNLGHEMERVAATRCHPDYADAAVSPWLRGYLLKALTGNIATSFLAGTPNQKRQRELAQRIGTLARELLRLLDDPCAYDRFTAWDLLDGGTRSARAAPADVQHQLQNLVTASRGRYWSGSDGATFWSLGARPVLGSLPAMLGALANLADWSIASESFERAPNKTARFDASVYVCEISRYLAGLGIMPRLGEHREKGFPMHRLIGITASVALSPPRELSADFVRRHTSPTTLIKTGRPI